MEIELDKDVKMTEEEMKALREKLSSQLVDTAEGAKAQAAASKAVVVPVEETVKVQYVPKAKVK